jgi:branched-chain amino acid transport system permease protein
MLAVSWLTIQQLAVTGVVVGCIYAIVALGFNVIFNATGLLNFAQGQFVLLGGFLLFAAARTWDIPLIPAILVTLVLVGVAGAVVQLLVVRQVRAADGEARVIQVGTALLAVAFLITAVGGWIWGVDPVPVPEFTPGEPIFLGDVVITRQQLWVVGVTVVVVILFTIFFLKTNLGLSMRAAALNPGAARGVGISVERMALLAFVIGCALAGLGGILITPINGVVIGGGLIFTVKAFTAAILGGLGDPRGAIVGGIALGVLESVSAAFISSGYQEAVPMVVLILVFMFRPGGIMGVGLAARA